MASLNTGLHAPETATTAGLANPHGALGHGLCIHELVQMQAAQSPNMPAVAFGAAQLTYGELDKRANQLAHYLQKCGVGPDTFVAICVERSLELPIALLAVLKAGGAYLPLDPTFPAGRLALMIEETQPVVLLTQQKFAGDDLARTVTTLCLDLPSDELSQQPDVLPTSDVTPRHLAYAMYTSGSTGTPRAVLVDHQNVVNHNLAVAEYFELRSADRVAQCTSLAFDISVEEIFPTLMRGATCVLYPPGVVGPGREFCQWLVHEQISVLDIPTAFWHEWVSYLSEHDDALPENFRLLVVGGQKTASQILATWRARAGAAVRWVNGYGPTEITIASLYYSPDDAAEEPLLPEADIPIGRTIAGTHMHVLDLNGDHCAAGVTGELYISGAGLARGYLNHSALTAQKFLPNPFSGIPGDRLYRTGDLARVNRHGRVEFGGRTDDQIKIRGFRVELGEIETVLSLVGGELL